MQVPPGRAGQMSAPSTGLRAMALEKKKVALIHGWTFGHVQSFDPQPSVQTEPTAAGAELPGPGSWPGSGATSQKHGSGNGSSDTDGGFRPRASLPMCINSKEWPSHMVKFISSHKFL